MATLRDSLLPTIDALRGIPGQLGLRLFTVSIVARTWTGERPGVGTGTDNETGLKVDLGIYPLKVRTLRADEIIASGGLYRAMDIEVGPITPPFPASSPDNDGINIFDPTPTNTPTEIFFRVTGPGFSAAGDWFQKVGQRTDKPFRYMLVLRKTAVIP